jgi:hypothetical protein
MMVLEDQAEEGEEEFSKYSFIHIINRKIEISHQYPIERHSSYAKASWSANINGNKGA